MTEPVQDEARRSAHGHASAPGRLVNALRSLLTRWLGEEGLSRPHSSSEVLLLEALHISERRGRLEFARALLIHRAELQVHAVQAVMDMGSWLQADAVQLEALRTALDGARRVLADEHVQRVAAATDFSSLLDAGGVMLDRFARLLNALPETLKEAVDRHLEARLRLLVVSGTDWQPTAPNPGLSPVQSDRVHADSLIGLALSGGGIRSASYAIGAIESLAKEGLLPSVDIVSSVSGGGYAAAWMSAWAYRHKYGIGGVQAELNPRAPGDDGPIRWVRRHCAYLAPRIASPGSSDMWALLVAYLTNWLPILALLCTAWLTLLLLPHALLVTSEWIRLPTEEGGDRGWRDTTVLACGVLFLAFAGLVRRLTLYQRTPGTLPRYPHWLPQVMFYGTVIVALALTVTLPLLWSWLGDGWLMPAHFEGRRALWVFVALSSVLLVSAVGAEITARVLAARWVQRAADAVRHFYGTDMAPAGPLERVRLPTSTSVLAAVLSAFIAAGMLAALARRAHDDWPTGQPAAQLLLIFGPLVLVICLAMAEIAGLALLHRFQLDRDRAWAAHLGGWMLAGVTMWTVVCGTSLGADALLNGSWRAWATAGVMALLGGVLAWRVWRLPGVLALAVLALFALGEAFLLAPLVAPLHPQIGAPPGDRMLIAWGAFGSAAAITAIIAALSNVNRFSLHALYKQSLVRTFLGASRRAPRNVSIDVPPGFEEALPPHRAEGPQFQPRRADPVTNLDDDDDPLLEWVQSRPGRHLPLLLMNAALNGRSLTDLDGRVPRQWPFTFSALFCGSPAAGVGYAPTSSFHRENPVRKLTLGVAMAVSGAAMSPTGGRTTHPLRAFILGILNARLGLWIGNPSHPNAVASDSPRLGGLTVLREMLGIRARFSNWVHLSDGGHFENLGIYELLRRGCRRIIAVDASCDPKREFADLANAIRRARVDLGIRIYRGGPWEIGKPDAPSGRSWTWFEVDFGSGRPRGRLLYVKPSVYEGQSLPVELRNYWVGAKEFPHETTADQFFTEAQMEAYRSLGQANMDDALTAVLVQRVKGEPVPADQDPEGLLQALTRAAAEAAGSVPPRVA